jgi:FkbM family methyltransferase
MSGNVHPGERAREIRVEETGTTISALRCRIAVTKATEVSLFVDRNEKDEIDQRIADQAFSFPAPYYLLLDLVQPGGRVLDLGAHIGTFALFAAAQGYEVVAVEASPINAALLRESARENRFEQIRVVSAAVSNRAGRLEFIHGGPYGLVSTPALDYPTISVPAITVDELLAEIGWESVELIKMDIEGSEVAAVQGMTQLLTRADAPSIVFESNGHTLHLYAKQPRDLMAALEGLGYRCYFVETGHLFPTQSDDLQPECNMDCLAVKNPPANLARWQLAAPMSLELRVSKLLSSCAHAHPHARAYIGRALEGHAALIASDPRIPAALNALANDADPEVRSAVNWWQRTTFSSSEMAELSRVLLEKEAVIAQLREVLVEKDSEIGRLRALVGGYERGRFIRTVRALKRLLRP